LTIPRIYSPIVLKKGTPCELGPDNRKYLKQVLRLKQGDKITVFDGLGHEFAAIIKNYSAAGVCLDLGEKIKTTGKEIKVILAQAIPKAGKMDLIVKNAAELGADVIIPFTAARSVSRIAGEKAFLKVARWQKIARETARCCRSSQLTEVYPLMSFTAMIKDAKEHFLKMIFRSTP